MDETDEKTAEDMNKEPDESSGPGTDPDPAAEPAAVISGGPTGVAGSDLERRAAARLREGLESKGRSAALRESKIYASEPATLAVHSLLTVAGSLIGLVWPAIGATVCLIAVFSFYAERGLGLRLIGRLLPGRNTANVLSPPPGPAWEEVELILATGYDVPDSYPFGEWLARRFSGRLTTDRILFYGGMIGSFAALMLRAVGIEGFAVNLFQTVTAAIPLAVFAAQIDRRLAGTPIATQEDLATARDVMVAAVESDGDSGVDPGIGICLFGAGHSSAGGAEAFFADRRLNLKPDCAVINLVRGARGSKPEVTAREGDLMSNRMNPELAAKSPLTPKQVALRSQTPASIARRRGLRAITVVGRGEAGIDVVLDAVDGALPEEEAKV